MSNVDFDPDRLLPEDDDGTQEDSSSTESETEENEGREYGDVGEETGEEDDTGDEGEDEEESGRSARADVTTTRRSRRIQNLNRRLQESNRRNEDLERRLNALEQGGQRQPERQQQQETQEQEQARMALMTPEERMNYTLDRGMRTVNAMVANAQMQSVETADRASFMALTATDRLAKRFAPQVEQMFNNLKSQGRMTAREIIYKYLVGEAAVKASTGGKVNRQRRQAQQQVDRQRRVNTGGGRSDVGGDRQRRGQTLEQRLEGKLI